VEKIRSRATINEDATFEQLRAKAKFLDHVIQ
jgi:hypothetical protein